MTATPISTASPLPARPWVTLRALGALAAVSIVALTLPAVSHAADTIGSSLTAAPTTSISAPGGLTLTQSSLPGSQLTSPRGGVIVRWRVRTGGASSSQQVSLRVLRRLGTLATGVRTSAAQPLSSIAAVQTFETRLPIRAGDSIGINCCAVSARILAINSGASVSRLSPQLGDLQTQAPSAVLSGRELAVNADVEADADGDGYGDETQDDCPTDARAQRGCEGGTGGALRLTLLAISPSSFRTTTRVSYRLTADATVAFLVERARGGRRVGTRCAAPTARNRGRRSRLRYVRLRGGFTREGTAGTNSFSLAAQRPSGKRMPGRYRLVAVAATTAGARSAPVRATFTIRR